MRLVLEPAALAVAQLTPGTPLPAWAVRGPLWSATRTAEELSLVCAAEDVPAGVRAEAPWRALRVQGPLDFAQTGILAALAVPLAEAGVSIFALATYDTDLLLVRAAQLDAAVRALEAAGHEVLR